MYITNGLVLLLSAGDGVSTRYSWLFLIRFNAAGNERSCGSRSNGLGCEFDQEIIVNLDTGAALYQAPDAYTQSGRRLARVSNVSDRT
jgi:hypothetical protein